MPMNLEDPCPRCGYHKKPYLMSTRSDAPGLPGLLKGEGDPRMQRLAKWGSVAIAALLLDGLLVALGIHI